MILTSQDLTEHYQEMRDEPFFKDELQDLEQFYDLFLEKDFPEIAAKKAIAFEYYDEKELIQISDPDKTLIILAIVSFLKKHGFALSLLTPQMQEDLEKVLKEEKVIKYQKYYHTKDFDLMNQTVNGLLCD